jgi:hypothetical protein
VKRRSGGRARSSDVSFCTNRFAAVASLFYVGSVIERYSRAPMRELWSEQRKFEIWLEIETLACEAMAELGQIPRADAAEIRRRARFSIPEINEIEKRTNHDVIAFLENVATSVGPAARWIHQGLTSSDILDTTLAVQLVEAGKILLDDIRELRRVVADQARRYKMTPMIGRSHGIHAEPITFGLKLALMFDEFARAEERLSQTLGRIGVGKLSGAVGTLARSSGCNRPSFRPRSSSAIDTQNSPPRSRSSRPASTAGRPSCGICSEPRCSKSRNSSAPGRKAARPCRTSATRSPPNG